MSEPQPDELVLREALAAFIAARLPDVDELRITGFDRNTEGFSQETFTLDAELVRGEQTEPFGYVVKRAPAAGLLEPYDLEPEFRVLHALSDAKLLTPPTHWYEDDPGVLERPFYVMEKLPGEVPIPAGAQGGSGPFSEGERLTLGPQVAEALAALHAIDWRERGFEFLGPPGAGRDAAGRALAVWETRIERAGFPVAPVLAESLEWLRRNLPETDEITFVHGDYRLGNLLVERDGSSASLLGILDWEMVHLGDPLEDVAWCCSELWRAGTPWAGAMIPPEEFAAVYAKAAGRDADSDRLGFYAVLSVVKMAAIMLTGIRAFADGRTGDLRMAIFDHQLPFLYALLAMTRGWLSGV